MYHSGNDDDECELVQLYLTCDDFVMTEGECDIYAEYYRCNDTYFYCWVNGTDATNVYYEDSCAESFEDA